MIETTPAGTLSIVETPQNQTHPTPAHDPMKAAVQATQLELMRTPSIRRLKSARRHAIAQRIVTELVDQGYLLLPATPPTQGKGKPKADA